MLLPSAPPQMANWCRRLVGIRGNSAVYLQTKGDANDWPDRHLVPAESVVGRVKFHTAVLAHKLGGRVSG